ncbi:hypothetical protein FPSE_01841 [Fusarium pseudograminearum CS3096]|uniref:Uncharacterized protein n=1 Tax=Fusarium pseudograminearum (strain CS3096) TaxID=1028729 RepID=K3W2M6_FUSPC|nr:hypothetical protein FPSE_01841 [Fusarium pseudograminearum CS3096]EKJ77915.1 hypothetical protein FPSE_01841 [Fusarium pseudograminearum CS3096]
MASINPFQKLPAELITIILGVFDSPKDIQSAVLADPYILHVFLQNQSFLLQPLLQNLYHHFPGQNLTQAVTVCRLRRLENRLPSQNRAQAEALMKPVLTSSPEPFSVLQMNLGALSDLYQLHLEADAFMAHYPKAAWEMSQNMLARKAREDYPNRPAPPTPPLSLPLSETEIQQMQKAFLVFDACRHTLVFSTSFLQDYGHGDYECGFWIPWKFIYQEKLRCVRAFQAVFVFIFEEYENLLKRIDVQNSASPLESIRIDGRLQRRQFLQRDPRDGLQFTAYLCSQGYHRLLSFQDMDNIAQEEAILSSYNRYLELKADPALARWSWVLIWIIHSGHFATVLTHTMCSGQLGHLCGIWTGCRN